MDENNYIKFDQYLNGELSESEKTLFERELNENTELRKEFNMYKALNSALSRKFGNEANERALRKTLESLGNTYIKSEEQSNKSGGKVISIFRNKTLMIVASIALLVSFFLFQDGQPVYSDFNNHPTLEITVRSDQSELISSAENHFNKGHYQEALNDLLSLQEKIQGNAELALFTGICYLELSQYEQAMSIFKEISTGKSIQKQEAAWYLALSYLKQEQYENCKHELKEIPEDSEYYERAKKLLKKLN